MREIRGKVALVTGAGSGIGRETALALARAGARLVVCDVNEAGLEAVRGELEGISECVLAMRVDVSKREEMAAFAEAVHARVTAVDILVNNAGVGLAGTFLQTRLEDWEWVLSINLWGVIHGCHYFLPRMVERGAGGHVVNVSSLLGYWVAGDAMGYMTAKFGVFALSEGLRVELRDAGIGVSTVCPGIIRTGIIRATRFRNTEDQEGMRSQVDRMYLRRNYGPERVAAGIMKAIRRNKGIVPISPESWLMYYVTRISPALSRWCARQLARQMLG